MNKRAAFAGSFACAVILAGFTLGLLLAFGGTANAEVEETPTPVYEVVQVGVETPWQPDWTTGMELTKVGLQWRLSPDEVFDYYLRVSLLAGAARASRNADAVDRLLKEQLEEQ